MERRLLTVERVGDILCHDGGGLNDALRHRDERIDDGGQSTLENRIRRLLQVRGRADGRGGVRWLAGGHHDEGG